MAGDLGDVDVLDGFVDIFFERRNRVAFERPIEFCQPLLTSLERRLTLALPLPFPLALRSDPDVQRGPPSVMLFVQIRPECRNQ